ncbi:MAG: hypothetical protein RBS07_01670 [Lentimicrobium sp.]|jgi:hypothetical protein|nr:hypothetical protein [Lentimicrobium sp.]
MTEYAHEEKITQEIKGRMTGYILVEHQKESPGKSTDIIYEGIQRFFGGFGSNTHLLDLGKYKLALMLPDQVHKLDCVSFYRHEMDFAFIEGTFSDFDLLRKHRKEGETMHETLAAELLSTARTGKLEDLKMLNGRYSGFVYLKEQDKLILITDQYGANRVFVYNHEDTFAVSNNVFALATNPHLSISVDEESIANILQIEYPAYRGTEFAEISLVLPSDIYLRSNKTTSYQKYYQTVNRTRTKSDIKYIESLTKTFDDYFKALHNYYNETVGIYLSKGKDCRLFLPFLEQNDIPYQPFVFKDGTGVFDYKYVHQKARLLDKDLHVLENYTVDKRLAFLVAMNTSPTLSWFALGSVAQRYTNTALMGIFGDIRSGKMPSFRVIGIRNKQQVAESFFDMVARGVTEEIVSHSVPYFHKFNTKKTYLRLFDDYPKADILFDNEVYHDVDHRSFRNALPILMRASHYLSPVTPYMDATVAEAYRSLPKSLISSQKAHTVIAALEKKTNKIQSTAFPISLKLESKIRPAMMAVIKLNNLLNNRFLQWQKKKFNPYVATDTFIPRSDYFKQVFGDQIPLQIGHKRLLTRMYNADDYLHLVFHDDILPLCKRPSIIVNELNNVHNNINRKSHE